MGYFVVKESACVSQATITNRARNYAALFLAFCYHNQSLTSFTKAIFRYLTYVTQFQIAGHISAPLPIPYSKRFCSIIETKRLITIMWSTTLAHGFPCVICCDPNHYGEMSLYFNDNYSIAVRIFPSSTLNFHYIHFCGQTRSLANNKSYAFHLANYQPIEIHLYDPIGSGAEIDITKKWNDFLNMIKDFVNNEESAYIKDVGKYKIKIVKFCECVFGYTLNYFDEFYENDAFTIMHGFYIEESKENN